MKNKIWNNLFKISHMTYLDENGEISENFWVGISICKFEIIWETLKKYNIKLSELKHIFHKVQDVLNIKEKLYKKENVNIEWTQTLEDLIKYLHDYKEGIKKSDRICKKNKKAILEAFSKIDEDILKKYFSN